MNHDDVNALGRTPQFGSRRRILATLAAVTAGPLSALLTPATSQAKKKRQRKKKAKSLKQVAGCAIVRDPPTAFAANGNQRWSQIFRPVSAGELRRITIEVEKSGSPGDYIVQLVSLAGNTPSHRAIDVLAATIVPDAAVPDGPATLVAAFAGPHLDANVSYAVAVSRPGSDTLGVVPGDTNACAGGRLFTASGANPADEFDQSALNVTLRFAVFVA